MSWTLLLPSLRLRSFFLRARSVRWAPRTLPKAARRLFTNTNVLWTRGMAPLRSKLLGAIHQRRAECCFSDVTFRGTTNFSKRRIDKTIGSRRETSFMEVLVLPLQAPSSLFSRQNLVLKKQKLRGPAPVWWQFCREKLPFFCAGGGRRVAGGVLVGFWREAVVCKRLDGVVLSVLSSSCLTMPMPSMEEHVGHGNEGVFFFSFSFSF